MHTWYDFGVTFDLDTARMLSTAIFETYFSYHKDMWIAATDYMWNFLSNSAVSISSSASIKKIYRLTAFSLPINYCHLAIELSHKTLFLLQLCISYPVLKVC